MVDYVPLLARAIAALHPNTSQLRHALYDRAREALINNLRASDPTLSHTDLTAERAALEAAIHRVEVDAVRAAAPPQSRLMYESDDDPIDESYDRAPLKDTRKRTRILAVASAALVILLAGLATYSFWPRIVSSVRNVASLRSVNSIVEQSAPDNGYVYRRQLVYYRTNHPVGTIVVDKSQTFLYAVRPNLSALRYSIGVGPQCTTLVGLYHIVRKGEWSGGKPSPLQSADSTRALYLNEDHLIHGTTASATSGQRAPATCVRLANDDFNYLYDRTPLESRVVVLE